MFFDGTGTQLDRNEFRFVPPLSQAPFIPAKAGIQGRDLGRELGSRFRGDERKQEAMQTQLISL
jgi:hypothetical protein